MKNGNYGVSKNRHLYPRLKLSNVSQTSIDGYQFGRSVNVRALEYHYNQQ